MSCMCGDIYCGSCGPAQGNYKCVGCGEWSSDFDEEHSSHGRGCEVPDYDDEVWWDPEEWWDQEANEP